MPAGPILRARTGARTSSVRSLATPKPREAAASSASAMRTAARCAQAASVPATSASPPRHDGERPGGLVRQGEIEPDARPQRHRQPQGPAHAVGQGLRAQVRQTGARRPPPAPRQSGRAQTAPSRGSNLPPRTRLPEASDSLKAEEHQPRAHHDRKSETRPALCAFAHRNAAYRRGADGAVQLALRPPHRRQIPAAHRGHRPRALHARGRGGHPERADMAGPELGRRDRLSIRPRSAAIAKSPSSCWPKARPIAATPRSPGAGGDARRPARGGQADPL